VTGGGLNDSSALTLRGAVASSTGTRLAAMLP
jgi:hypothetical protein